MTQHSKHLLQIYSECNAHGGTSRGPYDSQMDRRAIWYGQIATDKRTCVNWDDTSGGGSIGDQMMRGNSVFTTKAMSLASNVYSNSEAARIRGFLAPNC